MVRRTSIRDSLRELPADAELVDAPTTDEPVAIPAQAGRAEPAPSEPAAAPLGASAGRRRTPGKARGGKAQATASSPVTAEPTTPAGASHEPVRVLGAGTSSAKRVGLYLHPDDFRALALARVEDSADANARVRAMIALWRGNPRYQTSINRLARTAPSTDGPDSSTPSGESGSEPVRVLAAPSGSSAKRVGLYLHPDDFRALALARVEDSADANARVRAMIALWRGNPRYQKAVDKLARTAPRGGQS